MNILCRIPVVYQNPVVYKNPVVYQNPVVHLFLLLVLNPVSIKEVKNPDVTLADENIQRNRNLAENKRVDIDIAVVVIADNIVKNNYINILLNV
jgi:hypothetical protein